MRLQDYITEQIDYNILKRDCKQIIADLEKIDFITFLYRGVDNFYEEPKKITPRKDRRPLDSTKEWHDALNKEFYSRFKVKARSEGVFCKIITPTGYGLDNIILPIGNYYCLWSETVIDAYFADPNNNRSDYKNDDMSDAAKKAVSTYKKGSLVDVQKSLNTHKLMRSEVILICKKYYAISQQKSFDIMMNL